MHFMCVFYPIAQKWDIACLQAFHAGTRDKRGEKRDVPAKTERVATSDDDDDDS